MKFFTEKNPAISCLSSRGVPRALGLMGFLCCMGLLGVPLAQGHIIRCFHPNVCFAERIGNHLAPAWNAPITAEPVAVPPADPESSGPVNIYFDEALTLTTQSIGDDFFDWLDIYITGLSLGQTVLIERFLVDNDLGVIQPGAILMESHVARDGFLPLTGEIPNLSSVEDWDELRDGRIWTQLGMFGGLANMPGEYVIRVSSPLGSFPDATARLTINEVPTDESFFGQVVDDLGTPIAGALVALLQPVGGYSEILFASQADSNGDYILYAPGPDEVDLVGVAPGFVSPFQQGNSKVIGENENLPEDITLIPGTVLVSGQVLREGTTDPVAGLPVSFLTVGANNQVDGRWVAHTWTDANGDFSVMLTEDQWVLMVKAYELSSRNLIAPDITADFLIDTTSGTDITGKVVTFQEANGVIAGILEGDDGQPLEQVQVMARNRATNETTAGYTLANGAFTLPAIPGIWEVFPFSFDLEVAGYPGAMNSMARLTEANQSVEIQPFAQKINAILEGDITYESADPLLDGQPVGGLTLWAQNIVNSELVSVFQRTYNSDGYFNIYLSAGDWFVIPEPFEAAQRQLLFRNLPRLEVIEDPLFIENIPWQIVAVDAERSMQVTLEDPQGNPIPGIPMHAHTMVGMESYDTFGVTDANGVATLPAIGGHWHFHISHSTLRRAGFVHLPEQHLMVPAGPGSPVNLSLVVTPFAGDEPQVTDVRLEAGNMVVEGTAEAGQLFDVEGSFNLDEWFYAGRVIALDGQFKITDPKNAGHEEWITGQPGNRVFYRLTDQQ